MRLWALCALQLGCSDVWGEFLRYAEKSVVRKLFGEAVVQFDV